MEKEYIDQEMDEYCSELCYHDFLCNYTDDCIDYDCYNECIKRY